MSSIFSKIINREIPGYIVAENDRLIAFLDINPLVKGHTLVVPKHEVDYIFDNDEETLSSILLFSQKVAKAIEAVITCQRIGLAVIGLEVAHTHIHLVPMNSMNDINFSNPKLKLGSEELAVICDKIKMAYQS